MIDANQWFPTANYEPNLEANILVGRPMSLVKTNSVAAKKYSSISYFFRLLCSKFKSDANMPINCQSWCIVCMIVTAIDLDDIGKVTTCRKVVFRSRLDRRCNISMMVLEWSGVCAVVVWKTKKLSVIWYYWWGLVETYVRTIWCCITAWVKNIYNSRSIVLN